MFFKIYRVMMQQRQECFVSGIDERSACNYDGKATTLFPFFILFSWRTICLLFEGALITLMSSSSSGTAPPPTPPVFEQEQQQQPH